jgi:hypothetical protein
MKLPEQYALMQARFAGLARLCAVMVTTVIAHERWPAGESRGGKSRQLIRQSQTPPALNH